jgi:tripartite-type tricarboxylate transporter receptor subunit TctC
MTFRLPTRRAMLLCATASAALLGTQAQAQAAYPSKPIRMVVPFAAGGATSAPMRWPRRRPTATPWCWR